MGCTSCQVRKFKFPNEETRRRAIGDLSNQSNRIKISLEQVLPLFDPISLPQPGDWLSQNYQQGQTFEAYNNQPHNIVTTRRDVIYIQPLEKQIDPSFIKNLQAFCQCFFYTLKVKVLNPSDILNDVYKRTNWSTGKKQYNAQDILDDLWKYLKPDAFCLIAVVITDLYPRFDWNFVFGLASFRERTGVFSFARYDPRFYTQKNYSPNYEGMFWRAAGVMAHQIGHMFGIFHCVYFECLMNGVNSDQQALKKPLELCPVCLRKLQSNIKFDILERYKKIQQFIQQKHVPIPDKLPNFLQTAIQNIQKSLK